MGGGVDALRGRREVVADGRGGAAAGGERRTLSSQDRAGGGHRNVFRVGRQTRLDMVATDGTADLRVGRAQCRRGSVDAFGHQDDRHHAQPAVEAKRPGYGRQRRGDDREGGGRMGEGQRRRRQEPWLAAAALGAGRRAEGRRTTMVKARSPGRRRTLPRTNRKVRCHNH